jgi:hypothetical protein
VSSDSFENMTMRMTIPQSPYPKSNNNKVAKKISDADSLEAFKSMKPKEMSVLKMTANDKDMKKLANSTIKKTRSTMEGENPESG